MFISEFSVDANFSLVSFTKPIHWMVTTNSDGDRSNEFEILLQEFYLTSIHKHIDTIQTKYTTKVHLETCILTSVTKPVRNFILNSDHITSFVYSSTLVGLGSNPGTN